MLFIVLLSGCEKNNSDTLSDTPTAKDEEYNLMITNNSPLDLKSVVVTVDEKDTIQMDSLIDSNIKLGEVAKFQMKNGKHVFKVTLNPKKNYSVSREFTEIFRKGIIVDYEVIIEKNEVSIKKIKDNE